MTRADTPLWNWFWLDAARADFTLAVGMILKSTVLLFILVGSASSLLRAADEGEQDSAAGLPALYAQNYLVAKSTISRDGKLAVIYPTLEFSDSKEAKDMVVSLEPFQVLGTLPTDDPYFQNKSHGAISAQWSEDGSVALITLESKWGPGDVFVVELADGKVKRTTNVLEKLTKLLLPSFRASTSKKESYNDNYPFIFEPGNDYEPCTLAGNKAVKLNLSATNDPKSISKHPWRKRIQAEWDIAGAKFTSQKITEDRR
ncbi:MAG TPA: hypothetical protein VM940_08260 [Chthoniobacterales bacterium]|jgi:hypothetical protein|nr:hypothetical protein [Chthoniobacterales bacterium]